MHARRSPSRLLSGITSNDALINPPGPNRKLKAAARRYRERFGVTLRPSSRLVATIVSPCGEPALDTYCSKVGVARCKAASGQGVRGDRG
jgi:hypothetical protein